MELLELLVEELRRHDWAKDMDHAGLEKALELAQHENEDLAVRGRGVG